MHALHDPCAPLTIVEEAQRHIAGKLLVPSHLTISVSCLSFSFSHLSLPFLSSCLLGFAFLPLASFPLFATGRRIHRDRSSIVSTLCPKPLALALSHWMLLVLVAVPVANDPKQWVVRILEALEREGVALRLDTLQWPFNLDSPRR